MVTATTVPRVYVASLSDYNTGMLHGVWVDMTDPIDTIREAVAAMLALSPTAAREGWPAEEYAVHDYEGFGSVRVGESDRLEDLAELAAGIVEHGDAYAAWVDNGEDPADFVHGYQGAWPSVVAYAEEWLDATGSFDEMGEFAARYFDVEKFAADMVLGGDVWTAPAEGDIPGAVHVFATYY